MPAERGTPRSEEAAARPVTRARQCTHRRRGGARRSAPSGSRSSCNAAARRRRVSSCARAWRPRAQHDRACRASHAGGGQTLGFTRSKEQQRAASAGHALCAQVALRREHHLDVGLRRARAAACTRQRGSPGRTRQLDQARRLRPARQDAPPSETAPWWRRRRTCSAGCAACCAWREQARARTSGTAAPAMLGERVAPRLAVRSRPARQSQRPA